MLQITLTAKQHAYIIALMPDRGEKERMKYIFQVAQSYNPPQGENEPITVSATPELIASLFYALGNQPERIAAATNNEIKQALMPQIAGHSQAVELVQQVLQQNENDLSSIIGAGFQFIEEIAA